MTAARRAGLLTAAAAADLLHGADVQRLPAGVRALRARTHRARARCRTGSRTRGRRCGARPIAAARPGGAALERAADFDARVGVLLQVLLMADERERAARAAC